MRTQNTKSPIKQDLSLLAIEAAEELARLKKGKETDFKSFNILSGILNESSAEHLTNSDSNFRLDHATVISSAGLVLKKSIKEIVQEAAQVEPLFTSKNIQSKKDEIDKLISFFVALSDSATLYNEELEELKKHLG